MEKRLLIIGGGLAGCTMARLLKDHFSEVFIFEKDREVGGLCKSRRVGESFKTDISGGHIFNSKNPEVLKFVFEHLPANNWHKMHRTSRILTDNRVIGWPFEYNLWEFGQEFAQKCCDEMGDEPSLNVADLELYLYNRFGDTAYGKYYRPYNEKIWEWPLSLVGIDWIKPDKTPVATKEEVLKRNKARQGVEMNMNHAGFYYPNNGFGIQQLIYNIKQKSSAHVFKESPIIKVGDHSVDGIEGDVVISTIPIDNLLTALGMAQIDMLHYHGTDFVFGYCDFFKDHPDITWTYVPDQSVPYHRVANIGKIAAGQNVDTGYTLVEFPFGQARQSFSVGGHKFQVVDIISNRRTYPIPTLPPTRHRLDKFMAYIKTLGIYSCGRWGLHSYDNMDVTIEKCIKLAGDIIRG